MTDFLQFCFAGLALGALYALVALGFVVIFKATGVINFAQGGLVLVGAYLAYNFHNTWDLPFYLSIVLAMVATAAVGAAVERLVLRFMVGQPVFAVIMITIGLLFIMERIVTSIWGFDQLLLGDPWGVKAVRLGDVSLQHKDIWTIAFAGMMVAGFFVFFRYSSMGVAMRATAFDQEAALAQGISVSRVFALSWAIAGAVATLAGVMLSTGARGVQPSVGFIALAAFPAIILGGLDSPLGAVLGGVIIGVTQTLTSGYQTDYAPWLGSNFHVVMPYLVMIAILMVRPYGLFGTPEVRRI
jgi:branched-chain amino acid transport system permease protein